MYMKHEYVCTINFTTYKTTLTLLKMVRPNKCRK